MADPSRSAAAAAERYPLFEAGWRRAACPLSQLWVQYLGLGGNTDLFHLDAFMHGVMPLAPAQQDILANAINEQLDDLCRAAQVPYLHPIHTEAESRDPLTVLDALFRHAAPGDSTDHA